MQEGQSAVIRVLGADESMGAGAGAWRARIDPWAQGAGAFACVVGVRVFNPVLHGNNLKAWLDSIRVMPCFPRSGAPVRAG